MKGMETTESEGLDNIDCTEGHSDCKAGREEKSKLEAERSIETAENNGGGGWKKAERLGEGVYYNVFGARNVDYIAGEFGDVG